MKLDELRTVQSKERRKDSLQQLRDSFYEDVAAYIQDLKASRDRRAKQVDDPFSDDEVRRLSDELDTAKEVAEAVYERRVGKVVKLASFAAADMPVDDEGMTAEERELFDDLVARITDNKQAVLDVLSGSGESTDASETAPTSPAEATETVDTPTPPTERAADPETAEPSDSMLAEAMAGGDASTDTSSTDQAAPTAEAETVAGSPGASDTAASVDEVPPAETDPEPDAVLETTTDGGTAADVGRSNGTATAESTTSPSTETGAVESETETETPASSASETDTDDADDRTTLRITRDVGDIFGVDGREYTLQSEDVVTLPTANADPLVDRDAAMRLD